MSNLHRPPRTALKAYRQRDFFALSLALWLACGTHSSAQQGSPDDNAETLPAIESYARWISAGGRWAGPTTTFPDTDARPRALPIRLRSELAPLSVHAAAETGLRRARRALVALERAHALSLELGWPLPYPDGGLGGDPDFDLYLLGGQHLAARAGVDQPIHWASQDAAGAHAVVDADVLPAELDGCVLSAFAQAALLGQDPAEAERHRRATAHYLQQHVEGGPPCALDAAAARVHPERGPFGADEAAIVASAELLAGVSRRHDGGSGRWVREIWQLARQRSDDVDRLRASPSFVEALDLALRNAGESLEQAVVEQAVARAQEAAPPPAVRARPYAQLPDHLPVHEPGLDPYGSAYTRIDIAGAEPGARLDVWLRGEPGARWSLVALQLDGGGRELGRVTAPARRTPRAFIPLELDTRTAQVVLIVTALPDPALAPHEDAPVHYFRLILDRA